MRLARTLLFLLFLAQGFADTQKKVGGQFALAWIVLAFAVIVLFPVPEKKSKRIVD